MLRRVGKLTFVPCVIGLLAACAAGGGQERAPLRPIPPVQPPVEPSPLTRVVPTDTREPVSSASPPVPISGGTLLVTADGVLAVAADPDRDRVSIVDLQLAVLRYTVALEPGDEPGRVVEDDAGRVHVALRRGGAVASIDLATGTVVDRRAVCAAPRGIAFEAETRALHVACASGELVTLPADGGEPSARVALDADLRDVVVANGNLFVTRFKSAEALRLQAGASDAMTRSLPADLHGMFGESNGAVNIDTLAPEVAWRTVQSSEGGGLTMLHQTARTGEIALADPTDSETQQTIPDSSAYGGGGECGGVVQSELTFFGPDGEPQGFMRISAVLPVDVAVSGTLIAVAQAGTRDLAQPVATLVDESGNRIELPTMAPGSGSTSTSVVVFDAAVEGFGVPGANPDGGFAEACSFPSNAIDLGAPATAVAFAADGKLVAQTREPAQLAIMQDAFSFPATLIALGGDSVYDTGHELFHRDAGAGIACASCHAEGGDDGHVWRFSGFGARRTQSVNVGLEGTAPFHWAGDMDSVSKLMEEVFVSRMGGVHESPARSSALESFLYELTPPPAQRAADELAVMRGQALFQGEAECSTCHAGSKLTNNMTVDVGTGEALQVPSLVGVGYRAPLIHDGCAATLRDRFDPSCGGERHGKTAQLEAEQIDDLIAYLESL